MAWADGSFRAWQAGGLSNIQTMERDSMEATVLGQSELCGSNTRLRC